MPTLLFKIFHTDDGLTYPCHRLYIDSSDETLSDPPAGLDIQHEVDGTSNPTVTIMLVGNVPAANAVSPLSTVLVCFYDPLDIKGTNFEAADCAFISSVSICT